MFFIFIIFILFDQKSFDHFKVEQNIIVSFEEFIPQLLDLFATYQKLKFYLFFSFLFFDFNK